MGLATLCCAAPAWPGIRISARPQCHVRGQLAEWLISEAEREEVDWGEDIEEEQTQEMKYRLLRVDLRIRVVACSTACGAHRLSQAMS